MRLVRQQAQQDQVSVLPVDDVPRVGAVVPLRWECNWGEIAPKIASMPGWALGAKRSGKDACAAGSAWPAPARR